MKLIGALLVMVACVSFGFGIGRYGRHDHASAAPVTLSEYTAADLTARVALLNAQLDELLINRPPIAVNDTAAQQSGAGLMMLAEATNGSGAGAVSIGDAVTIKADQRGFVRAICEK
jgi:hypothetical protein